MGSFNSGAKCARTPSSCVDMLLTRADISGGSVGAAVGGVEVDEVDEGMWLVIVSYLNYYSSPGSSSIRVVTIRI